MIVIYTNRGTPIGVPLFVYNAVRFKSLLHIHTSLNKIDNEE